MAAFATLDDLAHWLGRATSELDATQAQLLLDGATAVLRREAGQQLSKVVDEQVTLFGLGPTWPLPEVPVVSVASVVADGIPRLPGMDWVLAPGGIIRRLTAGWPAPVSGAPQVTVVYTHGYDPVPDDLKALACVLAARAMANPEAVASESVGAYSVGYGRVVGVVLADADRALVGRYANPAVA